MSASRSTRRPQAHETVIAPAVDIYVARSSRHGRGVFASRRFEPDEVVEVCPVLSVADDDVDRLGETGLWEFCYEWQGDGVAVALGYGSLYNHSWTPSARYQMDYEASVLEIVAVRPIEPGEEITINYTGEPDGRAVLSFDVTDIPSTARARHAAPQPPERKT